MLAPAVVQTKTRDALQGYRGDKGTRPDKVIAAMLETGRSLPQKYNGMGPAVPA